MRLYERIDQYIEHNLNDYGDRFTRRQVEAWFGTVGWDDIDVGSALSAHKKARPVRKNGKLVKGRVFSTERVGMGPNSHYVLVQDDAGTAPRAVARMHHQQSEEMISRWEVEARDRMAPLFHRDKRALAYFERAATQMKLVAVTLDQDIQGFLDELLGEEQ